MKSRVITPFTSSPANGAAQARVGRRIGHVLVRSRTGAALAASLATLTLSGCYYPYGYYPSGYYASYPVAVPTTPAVQQDVPTASADPSDPQAQQDQQAQQAQASAQNNPTYALAAPPVYVAPAPAYPVYPAYYPPPVYPGWYGYPGYWGPSVSIGFGYWGGWGHGGGWHHHH